MIKREELITNNLKICENCYFCEYENTKLPLCQITNKDIGLFQVCAKFRRKEKEND